MDDNVKAMIDALLRERDAAKINKDYQERLPEIEAELEKLGYEEDDDKDGEDEATDQPVEADVPQPNVETAAVNKPGERRGGGKS